MLAAVSRQSPTSFGPRSRSARHGRQVLFTRERQGSCMKHPKQDASRREFLKTASAATAAAIAAPYVITSSALGADGRPPASDRIVMAGIGIGNMGSGDQGAF